MTVNLLLLKANFLWLSVWTSYWITKPEGGRAKWLSILVKKVNCGAGSLTSLVGVWAKVKTLFNLPCKAPFFFLLKLLFFFSSPSSITHFSCTRRHFQKVLSPRPRVKHKEKKKAKLWRLPSFKWGIVSHLNIKEDESCHRGHQGRLSWITGPQGFESRWLCRSFLIICDLCKLSKTSTTWPWKVSKCC